MNERLYEDADLSSKYFSTDAKDLLSKLLARDYKDRLGQFDNTVPFLREDYCSDIRNHPWFKGVDW